LRNGVKHRGDARVIRLPRHLPSPRELLDGLAGRNPRLLPELMSLSGKARQRRDARSARPELGELARVRRGVATGQNSFFVLSEASRLAHGLDLADVRACIVSPRLLRAQELHPSDLEAMAPSARRWLLDCRDPAAEASATALGRYLRWGKDASAPHMRTLARRRRVWYAVEPCGDAPILFTYMNRTRPPLLRNYANAIPLNSFLIIRPHDGVETDRLWHALNAPWFIEQLQGARRQYGRGLWKLEPTELASLRVPF
jgi:adenine-specific DNA-methyltransferase